MEAIAKHDFNKSCDDELSFKRGDVLKILKDDDEHWTSAEMDGHSGMVPKNYLQMKPHGWYKGKITRAQAEKMLLDAGQPQGAFLIRESEATPGDFSMSVRHLDGVQHFKVLRDGAGKYFLWVVKFNSLNELVDYHRTASVSRSQTIFLKDMGTKEEQRQSVVALYDFNAEEAGELSFKKGDTIELLENPTADWTLGQMGDRKGLIPMPYVKFLDA